MREIGMEEKEASETHSNSIQSSTSTAQIVRMPSSNSNSNSKRLLFDRRYGWVVDEWQDPSQEALAAGRGMFCIVPLAKGLIQLGSNSIDAIANSAVTTLESWDNITPQRLQATIGNQFQRLRASVQKPKLSLLAFNGKPLFPCSSSSLQQHKESSNLQQPEIL